jgi:hypothetical protein
MSLAGDRFGRNRQAHEAKEGRRGPHHVGREIGIPDADAGRLLRQGKQVLALLQSLGEIALVAPGRMKNGGSEVVLPIASHGTQPPANPAGSSCREQEA